MDIVARAGIDAPGRSSPALVMDGFVTFAAGGAALEARTPSLARIRPCSCSFRHAAKPRSRFSRPTGLVCGALLLRAGTYRVLFG